MRWETRRSHAISSLNIPEQLSSLRKLSLVLQQYSFEAKARRQGHETQRARRNSPAFGEMRRESLHRPKSTPHKGAVAMVGVAPPTRSGIAIFNQAILAGLAAEVDFFGDFSSVDEVRRMAEAVATPSSQVKVFSEAALSDALQLRSYRAAIFVLGNSDQNVFALHASRLAEAAGVKLILFHVHDPFLFNLYLGSIGKDRRRFRKEMIAAYGGQSPSARAVDALSWPPDLRDFLKTNG